MPALSRGRSFIAVISASTPTTVVAWGSEDGAGASKTVAIPDGGGDGAAIPDDCNPRLGPKGSGGCLDNVTLSTVSLVAGGVLAAGAITAAIFWPKTSREAARITPTVAPGYGGASFTGIF